MNVQNGVQACLALLVCCFVSCSAGRVQSKSASSCAHLIEFGTEYQMVSSSVPEFDSRIWPRYGISFLLDGRFERRVLTDGMPKSRVSGAFECRGNYIITENQSSVLSGLGGVFGYAIFEVESEVRIIGRGHFPTYSRAISAIRALESGDARNSSRFYTNVYER